MIKLNHNGSAISTLLYGLLIVLILIMSLIMSTMSFIRQNNKDFTSVIVKKLVNSNSSQTHIAITSAQMDIFPYLYAENYFSTAVSKDDDLKKYFSMMVSVN